MRKATKRVSEWLNLLCKDWASENIEIVSATDVKFLDYKPYLKGFISSQLLVRLSLPPPKDPSDHLHHQSSPVDFWGILGVDDEFDKAYIVAQMERFNLLYRIRGGPLEQETNLNNSISSPSADVVDGLFVGNEGLTEAAAAAAAAGMNNTYNMDPQSSHATAAAVAATMPGMGTNNATAVGANGANFDVNKLAKKHSTEVSNAQRKAKDAEKALENERRQNMKREQRRVSLERKEYKCRERDTVAIQKAAEKIARESSREERRRKKVEIRSQRENFATEQKEAALKRAAELVASNRVPIEITRGAAAAKAAASAALVVAGLPPPPSPEPDHSMPRKKSRSAIVVSTAGDLNQIVTHSKNLWAKYNAIAKEHNQKVNWITVAKELGIHVKVREKYARMHSRAEQRGFDWVLQRDIKIKDHPNIFMEPTQAEQKAKMPPPPPDASTTVLIEDNKEVVATDEAAVAAAAAVVDAAGVSGVTQTTVDTVVAHSEEETAAAAAVAAATLVSDPAASLYSSSEAEEHVAI
jgi:hypothetical protein